MRKKFFKKSVAIALTAAMTFGSALTVFAEGEEHNPTSPTETPTAGVGEGTGSYEGGELKYPTISVTLPTIPAGTYDYVADPNGLIEATKGDDGSAAKDSDSTYTGSTGIFFLTSTADDGKKTYTEKSKALTLSNENAQDIDVSVKLEQKTAGDTAIQYAQTGTFETSDKVNKLYLAITDDASTDPKVAALSASGAATLTTTVAGVPNNFKAGYDSGDGQYKYSVKDEADLTDWNDCSFNLTGAINKNATWGDNVNFPTIKVTWSYKEHTDAPNVTETSISGTNNVIHFSVPTGVSVNKVELVKSTGATTLSSGSHYSIDTTAGTITFVSGVLSNNVNNKIKIYFNNEPATTVELPIV